MPHQPLRVFASGVTELWADSVRPGSRFEALGEAALEVERPLHVAREGDERTLCGTPVGDLREYDVDFAAQEQRIRCPACDDALGNPSRS